jgi:hypothetical protein
MRVSTNGSATFAGQTLFTDGTTANPGIARSADVDDGIMLGEQIYVVRDGIQWVGISGSGSLGSIAIYTSPSLVTSVRLVGDASVNNVLQIGDDSATPAVVTLHGPDGVGTDIVGGDLRLGSGRCTGAGLAGACGKLILASTDIGVTGTTPRTLTDRLVVPQDGGLQFLTATKPTCNAAHRGTVFYVAGGAGVADTSEICRKDASDLYAWTTLF